MPQSVHLVSVCLLNQWIKVIWFLHCVKSRWQFYLWNIIFIFKGFLVHISDMFTYNSALKYCFLSHDSEYTHTSLQPTFLAAGWPDWQSHSMGHLFYLLYGCFWACCPPMGGQAHGEHSCYSRWQFAPDYKPLEFTHSCQLASALKDNFPYIIHIFLYNYLFLHIMFEG